MLFPVQNLPKTAHCEEQAAKEQAAKEQAAKEQAAKEQAAKLSAVEAEELVTPPPKTSKCGDRWQLPKGLKLRRRVRKMNLYSSWM